MAVEKGIYDETFETREDFQSCQYCFVKLAATPRKVDICDTSGELMLGILQNNPLSGGNAVVRLMGQSKLRAAGTVAVNGLITTNHSGQGLAITLTSGEYVMCQAAEALANGQTNEVIIRPVARRAQ